MTRQLTSPVISGPEESAYEGRRMEFVLGQFGLSKRIPELRADERIGTGNPSPTFTAFERAFPGFPIALKFRPIPRVDRRVDCTLPSLLKEFRRSILFKEFDAYERAYRRSSPGDTRPFGLIYPYPRVKQGFILHDGDFETFGLKYHFKRETTLYTIEPFDKVIRAIVLSGRPLPDGASVDPARAERPLGIDPDRAERLGERAPIGAVLEDFWSREDGSRQGGAGRRFTRDDGPVNGLLNQF